MKLKKKKQHKVSSSEMAMIYQRFFNADKSPHGGFNPFTGEMYYPIHRKRQPYQFWPASKGTYVRTATK